ncbi:MAG: flagellar filament capping protein FliD [Cellulomonas sp.]
MGSTAIDGLISGLKTTDLINSLMSVEAGPQTLLKTRVTATDSFVSALQGLNAKVAALAASAQTAAAPSSWQAVTASSSTPSASATASAGAQPSSLSFTIDALASAQTSVTGSLPGLAALFGGSVPASFTVATGSGADAQLTSIDLTNVTTLAGFASAINAAGAGVSASVVKVSATDSRLQLTGSATGAAAAFDLYSGTLTAADLAAPTPPVAVMARGAATTTAKDAQITLWPGTGAAQAVTSASNTFSGILTGVDVTVSGATAAGAAPTTITVARDDAALKTLASGLVTNLQLVLSEIASRTQNTSTTASDGRNIVTGGVLSGDSAVRSLKDSVLSAASAPVNGISPSTIGIVLSKDGTISYDESLFSAAMAADPAKVQAVVAGIADRLQQAASAQSDPIKGALTLKIQGQQSFRTALNDQVNSWDDRLAMRRAALEKTYAALEVSLSKLNSQSAWLTSQLPSTSS